MLALQAQMDPHFVYNMLATIGIMAEEGMVREIAESVEHLTHLLRYISSGKSSVVTLGEELEYARRYLACLKVRFRDGLLFDIQVPPQLLEVRVPKLIVQPIIENAMKYAVSQAPPWHLSIRGQAGGRWTLRIHDDSPVSPGAWRTGGRDRRAHALDPRAHAGHQRAGAAQHLLAPPPVLRGGGGVPHWQRAGGRGHGADRWKL
jgi:hypothetical protein